MCEGKRCKICVVPARPILFIMVVAGGKAGNVVNSRAMDKFSNPPAGGRNFRLFNLCNSLCKDLNSKIIQTDK